jgi:hypothetical protein
VTPLTYTLSLFSLVLIGIVGLAWASSGIKGAMKTILILAVFSLSVAIVFFLEK